MALDAATLALCAAELGRSLEGARIDKIYMPTRDEVVLNLRVRKEAAEKGVPPSVRLLIAARSGSARVSVTNESFENPPVPPTFCMFLRKHLTGGRLEAVRTPAGERILFLDFICTDEMGDLVQNTLAAELMGRYCNIVLVRGRPGSGEEPCKVMDALKRIDFEDSEVRQLLPGLPYTLPPQPAGSMDFMQAGFEEIRGKLQSETGFSAGSYRRMFSGIGPVVTREAVWRAFGANPPEGVRLEDDSLQKLEQAMQEIRRDFAAGGYPNLVRKPDGSPVEFSFTRLTQYEPGCAVEEYPSFSVMLEAYYAEKDRTARIHQKSKALRKNVSNLYERAVRKQSARTEEQAESEKSDHLRETGELLTGNLHAFQKGDSSVTLTSWYDGSQQVIKLDPRLSPSANAQAYFKEYKKKQTAAKMLVTLLEQGRHEISYLETVLYELDNAKGEADIEEIRAELKAQGYLKSYKMRDKKQKPADFIRYVSSDGFDILVGRNNAQNDKLTMKTARGKDLWFHTKNAPGSHVVVMSEGQDIPLQTQEEAAMLAVWHSSQKNSAKVPVDYTQVKNIRKTSDLPPGMVLYDHYETGYITPDLEIISRLENEQGKS